jgi:branched-chain amino acid transport system permease protein
MLAAGLAGAAFSVAIGVPAIRVPGLFLAVTTVAFASNMQFFFLNREYFGWLLPKSTSPVYRPILYGRIDASGDLAFYYVCLVFLALAMLSARSLRNSRSGRVLIAARDNPRAAQSYGVNLIRTRLVAFALAGFFAAIAGALYSYLQGAVDAPAFTPTASADLFTMTIIGGLTSVPGALVGATFLITVRNFLPNWHDLHLFAQGAGTILVLRFASGGLVEVGHRVRDRFLLRIADKHGIVVASLAGPAALPKPGANGGPSGKDAVETVPMPVVTAKAGNAAGARKTSRD